MTREQAISLLTQVRKIILGSESWLDSTHQPIEEAFNMAIEALKQSTQTNASNVLSALDTISRQAAIDAFLTELTRRERNNLLHTWTTVEVKYFITKMLENLPSAQPVIRCKDCKHFGGGTYCHERDGMWDENDFCSYAERKEQDDG